MTESDAAHPPCPVCGSEVIARRRLRAGQAAGSGRVSWRCSAAGCHWRARRRQAPDGAVGRRLQRAASPDRPTPAWRPPWRASGLLPLLALCVASPLAVVGLLGMSAVAGLPDAFGPAPGSHDDGLPVPDPAATVVAGPAAQAADPAPAHGLQLRRGCRWGQPGRAPYQGSTRQALVAAGLPEDVVAQIVAQQQEGRKSGRLQIRRDGIRHTGDGRTFPARGLALTFGMTLCLDASVNFPKGHAEMADLYEARDAQGRLHAVMVPDVCGNVSVLGAGGQQGVVAGMSASLARRSTALAALADALDPPAPAAATTAAPGPATAVAPGGALATAPAPAPGADPGTAPGGVPVVVPAAAAGNTADGAPGTAGVSGAARGGSAARVPAPLAAVGTVTGLLVPPQVAGGVVRQLGRVTASAGRGVESLAVSLGAKPPVLIAAGTGAAQPVPEPDSLAMVLLALAALVVARARSLRRFSLPAPSCRPCVSSSSSGRRPSSSSSSPASARTG